MVRNPSFNVVLTIILVLYLQTLETKSERVFCPIGFEVAYSKYDDDPICYKIKGPETFDDKFEDCTGNLFTIKRYQRLNFTKPDFKIWTGYKSLYAGGPFVDWSYTDSMGDMLETTYEVNRDPSYGVDEELCVIMDPVTNFTAVRCDEMHFRYCFVKHYPDDLDSDKGCESLTDGRRFWSPFPTCLASVKGEGGGNIRATWHQAQKLCENRGGSLLSRGWRYSNDPELSSPTAFPDYPLGIVMDFEKDILRYNTSTNNALVPRSEWHFADSPSSNSTNLGAVTNDFWYLVNSSHIFFHAICEKPVPLRHVQLNVTVDSEDKIVLTVNDTLHKDDIHCFTDSSSFFPLKVKKITKNSNTYILKPIEDGYYWCTHSDSKNFYISESKKALYIKVRQATLNLYAIKIRFFERYSLDRIGKLLEYAWKHKIEEYVYYSNKFFQLYELTDTYTNTTIMEFRKLHPGLDAKEKNVSQKIRLKRLFLDAKTALLHVELFPDMSPARPGQWEDMVVEFMHPVYYCNESTHPRLVLGESLTSSNCKLYKCTGNFNEGAQLLMTTEDKCYTPAVVTSTYSLEEVPLLPVTTANVLTTTLLDMSQLTERNQHLTERNSSSDSSEEDFTDYNGTTTVNMTTPGHIENITQSTPVTTENVTQITLGQTENITQTTSENITETDTWYQTTGTYGPPPPPSPTTFLPTRPPIIHTTTSSTVSTAYPEIPTTEEPRPPLQTTPDGIWVWPPVLPPSTQNPVLPPSTAIPELTTWKPEEQLQQVLENLESLLYNDTAEFVVEDINQTFTQVDELLSDNEQLEIPGNLLHLLDQVGARMNLNGSDDVAAIRPNVALLVADAKQANPVRGLKIAVREMDDFTDGAFEIIRGEINSTHLSTDQNEVVVSLPQSVSETDRRISFVVFRNDRAFQASKHLYSVNSRVLSVNVENVTHFEQGEVIDIHLTPLTDVVEANQTRSCAYWQFLEDGSGYWSQEGCTFIPAAEQGSLDTCRCDHLTHFAEVLVPKTDFSAANEFALEIISIVGNCLSILGLLMVGLTAVMFRSWRRDFSNKIWLQLCCAICLLSVGFLTATWARFTTYSVGCLIAGVLLHYATLASFCWMVVAGVVSYRRLVQVFARDGTHKLLRAAVFAWGAPAAVVGVLLAADPLAYAGRIDEDAQTLTFCYPSGLALWLSVYGPIALMVLANWTLFVLIVRSVFASRRIQRHGDSNEALRCASVSCLLVFLFGLPWIFGLFAFNVIAAYLFTILAGFQGFVLFLFFVCGNKKTRDLWLNKLKIKQTRKVPVTSSTYTNRSTGGGGGGGGGGGPGWRGPAPGSGGSTPASLEAKASKPRSLAVADDSRFS